MKEGRTEMKLIDGVKLKVLKPIPDERGRLMEIFRCDDEFFEKFGQAYMTTAYPGAVKGFHYHKTHTDNWAVIKGMMKVVLWDGREDSPTYKELNEFFLGEHTPKLIHIPPYVYHGLKCVSEEEAIMVNIMTEPYDPKHPDEYRTDPYDERIGYDWGRREE